MSTERDYSPVDQLMAQHTELDAAARKLRDNDPASALSELLPLLERHEAAESPAIEAGRNTLPPATKPEHEDRWRTIRWLASELQGVEDPPPDKVDQIVAMVYDHGVHAGSIFAKLHLLLSNEELLEMNAKILNAIAAAD